MLERNILIVDDDKSMELIHIPAYIRKINELKVRIPKWGQYCFNISHVMSMKEAMDFLSNKSNYVDVLLVDYKFLNDSSFSNGADFVTHIRESVNRQCQIVFYTMQGVSTIDNNELVGLINSNVYKFVDKCDTPDVTAQALFEACTIASPIVESLERFYKKYSTVLDNSRYTLAGEDISFEAIINHIRMDDEKGRAFIEKLLQKAILLETDMKD